MVRNMLLAAAAAAGLSSLVAFSAMAAPVPHAAGPSAVPAHHVVQADYYWHHRHYHHRHWYHGSWRYY